MESVGGDCLELDQGCMAGNETLLHEVAPRLLGWYARAKRDLPWRRTRDPYRIWVAEVMLQQARAETVIPYCHRFLKGFPTSPKARRT
jgi:adenine-specific DNA glycosylase